MRSAARSRGELSESTNFAPKLTYKDEPSKQAQRLARHTIRPLSIVTALLDEPIISI
jgi:hypothetical protein